MPSDASAEKTQQRPSARHRPRARWPAGRVRPRWENAGLSRDGVPGGRTIASLPVAGAANKTLAK